MARKEIWKGNDLIQASYALTLNEMRLIQLVLANLFQKGGVLMLSKRLKLRLDKENEELNTHLDNTPGRLFGDLDNEECQLDLPAHTIRRQRIDCSMDDDN